MSQPIDTAYVEIKPDLGRFAAELKRQLNVALRQMQANVNTSMRKISKQVADEGRKAGKNYGRNLADSTASQLKKTSKKITDEGRQAGDAFGDGLRRGVLPAARQAGDAVDDLGDEASSTARHVDRLDNEIEDLNRSLAALAVAYTAAGTAAKRAEISQSIRGTRQKLREVTDVRRLLPNVGDATGAGAKTATGFVAGFGQFLARLLARLPISPYLLAALAPTLPLIATAVSGALLAGLSTTAVTAGIAAAFQRADVKTAAAGLKTELQPVWAGIGSDFADQTTQALKFIRSDIRSVGPDLREALRPAAGYIRPLTEGFSGLIHSVLPSLRRAIIASQPVVEALGRRLPELGRSIGAVFDAMATHADAAAKGLNIFFRILEFALESIAGTISVLSQAFSTAEVVADKVTSFLGLPKLWAEGTDQAQESTSSWGASLEGLADEFASTGDAAATVTQAFDELFNSQLGVDQATISYRNGLADLKEQLLEGTRTLDENTAVGRQHQQAIFDQISAIGALRQARIEDGTTVEQANQLYLDEIAALKRTAIGAGYTATQISGLTAVYEAVPGAVKTRVSVPGASGSLSTVNSLKRRLQELDKLVVQPTILSPATGFFGFSHGGLIRGPGTSTSDSITTRVSTGEFVVRAAAVRRPGVLSLLDAINAGQVRDVSARLAALTAPPRRRPAPQPAAAQGAVPIGRFDGSDRPIDVHLTVQLGDEVIDRRVERIAGRLDRANNVFQARALTYGQRTV